MMRLFYFVIFCSLNMVINLNAEENKLVSDLQAIRKQGGNPNANRGALEKKSLELLKPETAPEGRGRIYSTIVYFYSENGGGSSSEATKSAKYAEEALKYPLDVPTTIDMYAYWGDAVNKLLVKPTLTPVLKEKEFSAARVKLLDIYLAGLKVILDSQTSNAIQEVPAIDKYDYSGSTATKAYKEIIAVHDKQVAERKNIKFQNRLVSAREKFINQCVDLYRVSVDNDAELRTKARSVLAPNYDKVTEEIMDRLSQQVSMHKEKSEAGNKMIDKMRQDGSFSRKKGKAKKIE